MWAALMQEGGGESLRKEVVINIQNAPTTPPGANDIAPEAVYTPLHDDPRYHGLSLLQHGGQQLLRQGHHQEQGQGQQWLDLAGGVEARPFPKLEACDDGTNATLAALQSWKAPSTSATELADICSQSPPAGNTDPGFAKSPCWNVQRSEDLLILWPLQDHTNAHFGLINTRLVSALGDGEDPPGEICVGAPAGLGNQLRIYRNCSELVGKRGKGAAPLVDGWAWNSSNGQLHHSGGLCVTAHHEGSAGGGGSAGKSFFGAIRAGPWKLIVGYPGNGKQDWDGWKALPSPDGDGSGGAEVPAGDVDGTAASGNATHCRESPCLFNIEQDPQERNDVAQTMPLVVQQLHARLLELGRSEVSVEASGLCPTHYGSHNDPRCVAKANATGFWEPWL
jgi:hypothetical protein